MSYRTIKRVLGESSLERKCRLLFGGSLLVLMLTTFYWHGKRTTDLVNENMRSNCRYLVTTVLLKVHLESYPGQEQYEDLSRIISEESGSVAYEGGFLAFEESPHERVTQPNDAWEGKTLEELRQRYREAIVKDGPVATNEPSDAADVPPIYETFKDAAPIEADAIYNGQYHYVQAVRWKENCVRCHQMLNQMVPSSDEDPLKLPFRAVRITMPYAITQQAVNRNYAILLATAIMTVFLSMLALYIVVRYVIVKPLQHLQEVSLEVERGNYDARAQIETNDEFEHLADAYNRMLRHLVSTQQQLRNANTNLDGKVDQLAQANMQLYEMNRVKSDFLANVSHELRTPLNSIIGFSDVLLGIQALDQKQQKYVKNIGNSGRVLLEMINDILDLAKMESGKMQVRASEFSLTNVVRAQCDLVRSLTDEKNIDLLITCPETPVDVMQDQGKVQQILTNLLSNAIKFTPEGGRISVEIEEFHHAGRPLVAMTVQDTGVGIAEEDREIIFEKFRQATATRGEDNLTRQFSGTGLGLSIVKELCKMLQGEITFTSQLGTGSAFRIQIPKHLTPADSVDDEEAVEAAEWLPPNHAITQVAADEENQTPLASNDPKDY